MLEGFLSPGIITVILFFHSMSATFISVGVNKNPLLSASFKSVTEEDFYVINTNYKYIIALSSLLFNKNPQCPCVG